MEDSSSWYSECTDSINDMNRFEHVKHYYPDVRFTPLVPSRSMGHIRTPYVAPCVAHGRFLCDFWDEVVPGTQGLRAVVLGPESWFVARVSLERQPARRSDRSSERQKKLHTTSHSSVDSPISTEDCGTIRS